MRDLVYKNSDGWYWPINDGNGLQDRWGSCWWGLTKHGHIPETVSEYAKEKSVLVQAGGNCGYYVKKYAKIFNQVYTFEPDPLNFYCLNLNVTEPNVQKFQACLGDEHKSVGLDNFRTDVGATHVKGEGYSAVLKIDDFCLPACDLIHLDIEGYELFALRGAINTIRKFKPVIAVEYYKAWAERYDYTLENLEAFFESIDYKFFEDVPNAQGDKIYKHKDDIK